MFLKINIYKKNNGVYILTLTYIMNYLSLAVSYTYHIIRISIGSWVFVWYGLNVGKTCFMTSKNNGITRVHVLLGLLYVDMV